MIPAELFNETRLLFHALKQWSETLHNRLDLTTAMRGVLELLLLDGSATVPDMARARGVSRQHIQQQVDALLVRGFVEREINPAHKRSSIISLSDKGRAQIQNLRADELNALRHIQAGVSDNAMEGAAQVLSAWRVALQRDAERRTR
jgi:DNA-binding MarR family transcriptional regulator